MTFRSGRILCAVIMALAASAAYAHPTVLHQCAASGRHFCTEAGPAATDQGTNGIASTGETPLLDIGRELMKPPTSLVGSGDYHMNSARSLPGVPGTLFMVLAGFISVSMFKDRRVWLAGMAGLLWLGQAPLEALPQLAWRLRRTRQIKELSPTKTPSYGFEPSRRRRSEIEGTKYIGLLRHLAGIPGRATPSVSPSILRWSLGRLDSVSRHKEGAFAQKNGCFSVSQPAIIGLFLHSVPPDNCPARARGGQPVCFSPAFIFNVLARAPPENP